MRYPGSSLGGAGQVPMDQQEALRKEAEQQQKRQQGLQIAQLILGSLPVVGGLLGGITGGIGMATKKDEKPPALPQPVGAATNDPNFRYRYDPRYYV